MLRDVEHERGFSHRRARRDDHEVGRLEARRQLVEIVESTGHAGDGLAAALERLDPLHRRPHELLDAGEAAGALLLTDLEDPLLGLIEQLRRLRPSLERLGDDLRRDLDEVPEQRLLTHDARVKLHVGRRRNRVDQERDVFLATAGGELAAPFELIRERQRIGNGSSLRDRDERAENPPMPLRVEHRVIDVLGRAHDGVAVHEHGGEHGLLGVFRIRRTPFAVGVTPLRRDRVLDGRAGHLPRWGASTPGYAAAQPGGT
jgi:hypothetical protein